MCVRRAFVEDEVVGVGARGHSWGLSKEWEAESQKGSGSYRGFGSGGYH